jgi:hypothetical protein
MVIEMFDKPPCLGGQGEAAVGTCQQLPEELCTLCVKCPSLPGHSAPRLAALKPQKFILSWFWRPDMFDRARLSS